MMTPRVQNQDRGKDRKEMKGGEKEMASPMTSDNLLSSLGIHLSWHPPVWVHLSAVAGLGWADERAKALFTSLVSPTS